MSQYRNKSSLEHEKELIFLLARDGRICNTKNKNGCGRTIEELIQEEERVRKITNKERKSPIFQIDHINGNSHQRDGHNGEYCGNEQLLCTPCHIKKTSTDRANNRQKKLGSYQRDLTPEMDKNIRSEPEWMRTVTNYIYEHHSICMSLARYGFANLSDITTQRYLKKRLVSIDPDLDPVFETGWGRCKSALCNSIHLYLYGNAPVEEIPQQTDLDI